MIPANSAQLAGDPVVRTVPRARVAPHLPLLNAI
jgi:hypothetical protein